MAFQPRCTQAEINRSRPIEALLMRKERRCAQWSRIATSRRFSSCVRLFRLRYPSDGAWPRWPMALGGTKGWGSRRPLGRRGPELFTFEPRKNAVRQEAIVAAAVRTGELHACPSYRPRWEQSRHPARAPRVEGVVRIVRRRRMRGLTGALGSLPGIAVSGTLAETSRRRAFCFSLYRVHHRVRWLHPSPKPALTPGRRSALAAIDRARETYLRRGGRCRQRHRFR